MCAGVVRGRLGPKVGVGSGSGSRLFDAVVVGAVSGVPRDRGRAPKFGGPTNYVKTGELGRASAGVLPSICWTDPLRMPSGNTFEKFGLCILIHPVVYNARAVARDFSSLLPLPSRSRHVLEGHMLIQSTFSNCSMRDETINLHARNAHSCLDAMLLRRTLLQISSPDESYVHEHRVDASMGGKPRQ